MMKKQLTVFSSFDGLAGGLQSFKEERINVKTYYASEIDKNAIKVAMHNHSEIIQLGDIAKWREWDIDWSSIDIIIGGSPCQDFSTLNRKRDGLKGEKSGLFYVYRDIVNYVKTIKPNVFFLLENNKNMPTYAKNEITKELGVDCILIDSSLVSAQYRKRIYWTNINNGNIPQPKDKRIMFQQFYNDENFNKYWNEIELADWTKRKAEETKNKYGYIPKCFCPYNKAETKDKHSCLTAQGNSQTKSSTNLIHKDNKFYMGNAKLWEKLQTLPENYTACLGKENLRKTTIGNGWTIAVIRHIFSFLPDDYKHNKEIEKDVN